MWTTWLLPWDPSWHRPLPEKMDLTKAVVFWSRLPRRPPRWLLSFRSDSKEGEYNLKIWDRTFEDGEQRYMNLHLAGSPQHTHSKSLHFPTMRRLVGSLSWRRWVLYLEVHCIGVLVTGKTGRLAVYRNLMKQLTKWRVIPSYQIICE